MRQRPADQRPKKAFRLQRSRKPPREAAELAESLRHQSEKLLAKVAKVVKGFLIQKCTRKIAENDNPKSVLKLESSSGAKHENDPQSASSSHNQLLALLTALKGIDHVAIGRYLSQSSLAFSSSSSTANLTVTSGRTRSSFPSSKGNDEEEDEDCSANESVSVSEDEHSAVTTVPPPPPFLQVMLQHKRMCTALQMLQGKISDTIQRNEALLVETREREERRKRRIEKQSASGAEILTGRRIGQQERVKGVFLESLHSSEEAVQAKNALYRNLNKKNKSQRENDKNPTRKKNSLGGLSKNWVPGDPLPVDLDIYKPAHERGQSAASGALNRKGHGRGKRNPNDSSRSSSNGNVSDIRGIDCSGDKGSVSDRSGGDRDGYQNSAERDREGGRERGGADIERERGRRSRSGGSYGSWSSTGMSVVAAEIVGGKGPGGDGDALVKSAISGKDWKETGLHPSWAAKQRAKMQQAASSIPLKISASPSAARNPNKIVFDD